MTKERDWKQEKDKVKKEWQGNGWISLHRDGSVTIHSTLCDDFDVAIGIIFNLAEEHFKDISERNIELIFENSKLRTEAEKWQLENEVSIGKIKQLEAEKNEWIKDHNDSAEVIGRLEAEKKTMLEKIENIIKSDFNVAQVLDEIRQLKKDRVSRRGKEDIC